MIRTVGVCGAGGTMGAGIAISTARAGFRTLCFDAIPASLDRTAAESRGFFDKSVARGKMTVAERDEVMARLIPATDMAALSECDLVIEAVFEELSVKQSLFRTLHGICPDHTIFASNTSTLSITEIASRCGREDRVIGLHYCLPAQLMKLIEVSPGVNTSHATLATAWAWTEACGQRPVRTQDKPGFILNALLVPFNNDAIRAIEAGLAGAGAIDTSLKIALGYKMGPLELIDLIGLDTQIRLCEAFYPVTLDPRAAAPPLLRRMVAAGHLGRKSGRGFYTYEGNRMFGV
jgi:3-hydroxybutyryl-CoA dehydrogenase